jgi:pathogenesis-related protein 1
MNQLRIMNQKVSKEITLIFVMTTLLIVLSSVVVQLSYAQSNTDLENIMLKIHNDERDAVGVPPLTWSSSIAANAQSWANHLTTLGLICDPARADLVPPKPICDTTPHGAKNENIAAGLADFNSPEELALLWADEKAKYNAGQRSGPGIGHYTAMVWQDTQEIGCGFASSGQMDFLVCRYNPPGNLPGQTPY